MFYMICYQSDKKINWEKVAVLSLSSGALFTQNNITFKN
jgi:hypothetical protein